MDQHLSELYDKGIVSYEDAVSKAIFLKTSNLNSRLFLELKCRLPYVKF